MSRTVKFATGSTMELLPDYLVDAGQSAITLYIDSNKEKLADVMAAVNTEGAMDKIETYKDGSIENVYSGFNVFSALSSTGIAYALTLSRKSDEATIQTLSKQVSDLTVQGDTSSKTAKQNAEDITNLQMAVASLYEQTQAASSDTTTDKDKEANA